MEDFEALIEAVDERKLVEHSTVPVWVTVDGALRIGLSYYRNRYDAQAYAVRRANEKGDVADTFLVSVEDGEAIVTRALRWNDDKGRWSKSYALKVLLRRGLRAPLAAPLGPRSRLSALSSSLSTSLSSQRLAVAGLAS
jgi:hypothetical protein